MRLAFSTLLLAASLNANNIYVYSELTRIDPFGEVVAQDRGATPRTILSPGFARNAVASLRVVVALEKPGKFQLDIAQNPDNAVAPTLYKEIYEKVGNEWIPDRLEKVAIPYDGTEADYAVPGQKVVTFWLDMKVDKAAPVERVKVEPQMWVPAIEDWVVYPMEVRILDSVLPDGTPTVAALPDVSDPADAAVLGPLRKAFCGTAEKKGEPSLTARAFVRRNAELQLRLASSRTELQGILANRGGGVTATTICGKQAVKSSDGPEWYLKLRDALFRAHSSKE